MKKTWSKKLFFLVRVILLVLEPSPRLNANLLQRSEVVALINTLHRFSESLHAVDVFRRLWRESSVEESAKLVQEAQRAVNTPVSCCAPLNQCVVLILKPS
jgi:Endoplasmic Reticulum Oxidoreductin 1 (ERO1)